MKKIFLYIAICFLILPEIQAQVVKYSGSMSGIAPKRVDGEILVDTIASASLTL